MPFFKLFPDIPLMLISLYSLNYLLSNWTFIAWEEKEVILLGILMMFHYRVLISFVEHEIILRRSPNVRKMAMFTSVSVIVDMLFTFESVLDFFTATTNPDMTGFQIYILLLWVLSDIITVVFVFIFFVIFYVRYKQFGNSSLELIEITIVNDDEVNGLVPKIDEQEWNALSRKVLSADNSNTLNTEKTVCAICIDNFKTGDELVYLPCSHGFHDECVKTWIFMKGTCPLCKHAVVGHAQ